MLIHLMKKREKILKNALALEKFRKVKTLFQQYLLL